MHLIINQYTKATWPPTFKSSGLCIDNKQELPRPDGSQGGADILGIALHSSCISIDRLRHRPKRVLAVKAIQLRLRTCILWCRQVLVMYTWGLEADASYQLCENDLSGSFLMLEYVFKWMFCGCCGVQLYEASKLPLCWDLYCHIAHSISSSLNMLLFCLGCVTRKQKRQWDTEMMTNKIPLWSYNLQCCCLIFLDSWGS